MHRLTPSQYVLVIAGLAGVDPRTVRRYLRGDPVRTSARERIERALEQERGPSPPQAA